MKKEKGIPLTRKKREIRASITAEYQKPSPLTKNLRKHSENLFKVTDTAVQALIKINGKGVCHLGLIHNDENILYDVATNEASIINYGFSLLHFGWMTGLFANEKAKQYPQEIEELNQEFKGGIFKIPLITSPLFTFENMLTIYPYYYPVSYILNTGFWLSLPSSFAVIQFLIIRIIVTLIATITLPILCSDPCSKTLARENSFIIAASSIVLITLLSACLYFSLPSLLFIAAFGQSIFTSGFIATLAPIISSYSGMLQLLAALHVANHYVQPIPSFLFVAIKPHLPDWLLSLCIEIRFNPNYRPSTYFKRAFYSRPETVSSAAAKTAPAPEPSMA